MTRAQRVGGAGGAIAQTGGSIARIVYLVPSLFGITRIFGSIAGLVGITVMPQTTFDFMGSPATPWAATGGNGVDGLNRFL